MTNPAYLIALLDVSDMEKFQSDYILPLKPVNERYGVEVVAVGPSDKLEGAVGGGMTAILRFPSRANLDAWYADPDYQPLIARRQELTDTTTSAIIALSAR